MSGVFLAEDDVEFAGYEGGEGRLGLELGCLDAECGVLLAELGQGGAEGPVLAPVIPAQR